VIKLWKVPTPTFILETVYREGMFAVLHHASRVLSQFTFMSMHSTLV